MAEPSAERRYRGVEAAIRLSERRGRLLAAGLDLLGSDQDTAAVTVRAACARANLTPRYFYENFSDRDGFVGAVFDSVIAELAATTQAAVASVPVPEQSRAGMANIVRTIAGDTRIGRLLFSTQLADPVIVRKRAESTALFAMLLGQHASDMLQMPANIGMKAGAHFAVGGVGQMISAWLAGDIALDPDQLVDQLAVLLDELAHPRLYGVTETAAPATAASRDPGATASSS
ncbi:TetR/AcrR family transcriptional regulator [Mycobacterium sherrisii]